VAAELRVIATAGHVDHGKSSLIVRLTGIDPDRFAEEKRRGLTIDLGYAWTTLPSGREVGFVDVPGHERFIGNMLAGVGPVRLVLFVVAADEGWKPQSEEHLQILDVLGVDGGVVALTKRDLVDLETLEIAEEETAERMAGTALEGAPIVPVSSVTGAGVDDLRDALDAMLAVAPTPEDARARLFIDRVFTIKGAGTVVTGTLAGEAISVGEEVELFPTGARARIRSLQTHKRAEDRAEPVSRVAANLVGAERQTLERGDVLGHPGAWTPTDTIEASLRPVRDLAHPITVRGAFKLYAGAAESDAKLRILGGTSLEPGGEAFVRIRLARPLVLDVFDRFVLREAGRRETVAGGIVLDVAPPARPGPDAVDRLMRRAMSSRAELPALLALERGAVRAAEAERLTGSRTTDPLVGGWLIRPGLRQVVAEALAAHVRGHHAAHPLEEGAPVAGCGRAVVQALRREGAPTDADLVEALIDADVAEGALVRTASALRLTAHVVSLDVRSADIERLLAAVGAGHEPAPPTVKDLQAQGIGRDVLDAAAREGLVVRVSPELVFAPGLIARAEAVVQAAGATGITVSAFREALGTSRKYAVPLLEWFDTRGVTRRDGDLRFPRGS
jgi:selenocysteine-specific elongation factor